MQVVRVGTPARINPLWFGASGSAATDRVLRELRALFRLAACSPAPARLWQAARVFESPDVVHANDLDTLPAGYLLARVVRTRGSSTTRTSSTPSSTRPRRELARRLTLLLEGALARRADAVVTVSEGIAQELSARLRLRDAAARRPRTRRTAPARRGASVGTGPLRAVYQGGLGPGSELDDLLAAAGAEGVELTIRIRMADPARAARESSRGAGSPTAFTSPIRSPRRGRSTRCGEFDVGVIFDRPRTRNSDLSVPNKLFEYLMAGLAVVAPHLETLGPLIDGREVGPTYEPDARGASTRARGACGRPRRRSRRCAARARALAVDRFNAEAAAEMLAPGAMPVRAPVTDPRRPRRSATSTTRFASGSAFRGSADAADVARPARAAPASARGVRARRPRPLGPLGSQFSRELEGAALDAGARPTGSRAPPELATATLEPLWPDGRPFAICLTHDVDLVSDKLDPEAGRAHARAGLAPDGRRHRFASPVPSCGSRARYAPGIARAPVARRDDRAERRAGGRSAA